MIRFINVTYKTIDEKLYLGLRDGGWKSRLYEPKLPFKSFVPNAPFLYPLKTYVFRE